ncbi:GNAT family N-acetyltransferase [Kaistia dalseonensis]|uniref:GNAT superfamily N-acetyltransferase n=1 Tax=Kaistia dalseonensis TaxID=410840 RepID=A0ABU0HDT1_9HYPH|nr:GNAT family N-acetyltransferase [Kaistia dalseonensis]MCX5497834.1 GNAT family N-acetyltransferase [Kaistia dalseonensis]MDQ0440478.1 GNAT superfamily N-acetyltransferase [Kaistia dalseonensis]
MVIIRPFQAGDTAAIAALILPIQQDEFAIPVTYEGQPDLAAIEDVYQRDGGGFWVAVDGEALVGTIGLKDFGGGGALRKMYVRADHRGDGTARRLLDALLDHAKRCDLAEVYLGTTDALHAAHRFYEKNGFAEIAPDALPAAFPRVAVDTKFYRRDLAAGYHRAADSGATGDDR